MSNQPGAFSAGFRGVCENCFDAIVEHYHVTEDGVYLCDACWNEIVKDPLAYEDDEIADELDTGRTK